LKDCLSVLDGRVHPVQLSERSYNKKAVDYITLFVCPVPGLSHRLGGSHRLLDPKYRPVYEFLFILNQTIFLGVFTKLNQLVLIQLFQIYFFLLAEQGFFICSFTFFILEFIFQFCKSIIFTKETCSLML